MSIMVKLAIENRPGVLTRIITALRNLEQVLETNAFGDHPDPAMATLALSFKGHGLSNQQIQQQLWVSGVIELITIQGHLVESVYGEAELGLPQPGSY